MTTAPIPYFHDAQPYTTVRGVGGTGRSWSGAGVAGVNNDRSWSGSGTASVVLCLNNDVNGGGFGVGYGQNSQYGAYVWIDSGGGSGCVWSVHSAVYAGYQFFWSAWVNAGAFLTTLAILNVGTGTTSTFPLSLAGLDLEAWNWVTAGFNNNNVSFGYSLSAQIYGKGNVFKRQDFVGVGLPIGNADVQPAATLGDGTDLNGLSATMPDVPAARRSKLVISKLNGNQGPPYRLLMAPPPWNDLTVPKGYTDYYYLGTGQTPGAAGSITENGAGVNNLSGGYHIYGDLGPFAG